MRRPKSGVRMKFLHPERDALLELSLDDVFIVPGYFDGVSRLEIDLTPPDFGASSHPIVSANMNAVTGKRMAETMARHGGLGVLPQDMTLETVERMATYIKSADPRFDTPLEVTPDATVRDVQGIIRKRAHDMVVVVDDSRRPIGVVTWHDLRDRDQYTAVGGLMSRDPVTVPRSVTNREAFMEMEDSRLRALPVVDDRGQLYGIITRKDCVRVELLGPSLDGQGRLAVAAALGISSASAADAVRLADAGIDAIVLDTAHGHQRRMLEAVRETSAALAGRVPIVAGNVCTAEGTEALMDAGADVVKVNVGPGAMCTTRMQTGCGRPTFSAVRACAEVARARGRHIWADGGVRHPRDVALYLAAGASRVMVGTMLSGTYESPGDIKQDPHGRMFKENYGMASARAVRGRASELDAFDRAKKAFFREGISTSRIYLHPGREAVGDILIDAITGVQSAFSYAGARSVNDFWDAAVVGVQTHAGFHEGTPHGRER